MLRLTISTLRSETDQPRCTAWPLFFLLTCEKIFNSINVTLRATAVPAGTAEARISYGDSVRASVCPSVCHDPVPKQWDRDSGSSPYDSLESLVSNEVIWCHWVKRFLSNEGIKEGYPLRNRYFTWNRYFTTIGSSSAKRLQIDTDLLLIITSTADELSSGTNIDDLERPWPPKLGF